MAPSPLLDDPDVAFDDALEDFKDAATIFAKQRPVKISTTVDRVSVRAYEFGLQPGQLELLIDVITLPNELDQASINSIIRNLYPASRVSDDCVLKVVGSLGLGQGKPAFSAQANLLKWLVMVYDVLESPKLLSQMYSFLFNLLDIIAIRAPLCHLLSLITRRKHVRPFRIQSLLELARRAGNEPQLIGLIRVYKDYYPDVIVGEAIAGRASIFSHPNVEWRQKLAEVQAAHLQRSQDKLHQSNHAFKVVRRGINGVKRSRVSLVPEVHTSRAQETSTTLEEIESASDLVSKLEKIELPNQLIAVLRDPLLHKLLQLKAVDNVEQRINNWMNAFFEDLLSDDIDSIEASLDLLNAVCDYSKLTKALPVPCLAFLENLLPEWDGETGQAVILELLSYIPLAPFLDLQHRVFTPLEDALLDDSAASQVALLEFYTKLLRQWSFELLSTPPPAHASSTITQLITHINTLAHTLLQNDPTAMTHASILAFYETTASLITHTTLQSHLHITTPPSSLVYTLHFSSSLSTLSRLCGILALYKRAFETSMSLHNLKISKSTVEPYPKEYVNHFNGFLMDICNCLWRNRAFNTSDTNALGCLLPAPLLPQLSSYLISLDTGLHLQSLFSLSYSPLLCLQSISYLRNLEDGAAERFEQKGLGKEVRVRSKGPVTQAGLKALAKDGGVSLGWPEYRLGVLRYLESNGVNGVGELMYNTMKHLMQSRPESASQV